MGSWEGKEMSEGMKAGKTTEAATGEVKIHVFERAGLGKAPFRFVGCETKVGPIIVNVKDGVTTMIGAPGQPMSCCDYCGTSIAEEFWLRSADGKKFKVGCDCIGRAGDGGLKRAIAPAIRAAQHKRDDARIEAARAALDGVRAVLAAQPHPYPYLAAKGLTAVDFVDFNMKNGGRSGRIKAARMVEAAAKARQLESA